MSQFDPTAPVRPSASVRFVEGPRGPAGPPGPAGGRGPILFSQAIATIGSSGTYRFPEPARLRRAGLRVGGAPAGSDLSVELLLNSDVVCTLTIADGTTIEATEDLDIQVAAGDLLAVNALDIGSTTPAEQVVAQVDLG